jgi:quercetin dioxygenase-like cupin family protein
MAVMKLLGSVLLLLFVLSPAASAQAPEIVPVDKEPMHKLVFENEYVRVFSVEVPPHSETKIHQHDRDYIFVTLGDSDVASERVNEPAVHLQLKDGESRWTKGGFAHKAKNLSDKPFHNITIELKQDVGKMECGVPGLPECPGTVLSVSCPGAGHLNTARSVIKAEQLLVTRETVCPPRPRPARADALLVTVREIQTADLRAAAGLSTPKIDNTAPQDVAGKLLFLKKDEPMIFPDEKKPRDIVVLSFGNCGCE